MFPKFNKRGAELEKNVRPPLLLLLIFGGVFLTLYKPITSIAKDSYYETEFLSRDISLNIESMMAVPGNVILNYKNPLFNYTFILQDGKVIVLDNKTDIRNIKSFSANSGIKARNINVLGSDKLFILKNGNDIEFNETNKKPLKIFCPKALPEKKFAQTIFVLDPGHGGDDFGINVDDFLESEIVRQIADSIVIQSKDKFLATRNLKKDIENNLPVDERLKKFSEKGDVLVSIHSSEQEGVTAYFNGIGNEKKIIQNRALACSILNSIYEFFPDIGFINLLPVNPGNAQNYQILNNDKPGVIIEIGNVYAKNSVQSGTAIFKGLKNYFNEGENGL